MMFSLVLQRAVAAEPERVFALASDFPNLPSYMPGITKVEMLTPGPVGSGTRFKESRRFGGRTATETMTVAEFDPPNSYVLTANSCGCAYRSEVRVARSAGGSTLSLEVSGRPVSFVARLMSPLARLMAGTMRRCMEKDLDDLKTAAERATTSP